MLVAAASTDLALLVQATLEHRAREHGLSLTQSRLLEIPAGGRKPTMNELAQLLRPRQVEHLGLVDRAQRRGLVRRVPSQLDRRSVRVRLTKQGSVLHETLSKSFAKDVAAVLEPLTDGDRQTLTALTQRDPQRLA